MIKGVTTRTGKLE